MPANSEDAGRPRLAGSGLHVQAGVMAGSL